MADLGPDFAWPLEELPPPIHQGVIGACSGAAALQCMNFMLMHKEDWPDETKPSLAELVNEMHKKLPKDCHPQEFEPNSTVPTDGGFLGFDPPAAFHYMQKFGVCLDRYHPYEGRMTKRKVPARSPRIRIGGYTVLTGNYDIKPIIRKHPIVGEFVCDKSFDDHVDGIYRLKEIDPGYMDEDEEEDEDMDEYKKEEKTLFGHSVLVYGYGGEDKDAYLNVQNTWKPEDWGKDGHGMISEDLFHRFSFIDAESISLEQPGTNDEIATIPSVVELTPDNFDELVLDETKDVLVEFYDPWWGYGKNLATYEEVASAFKLEEDVIVANLDAQQHKDLAERYDVSVFPTLKFFSKGNKAGEDYDSGRYLDNFVNFINEKCGTCRDTKGQLTDKAGIVEALDKLVKEFVTASSEEKKTVYNRMKEEVKKLKGSASRYGKIYLKAAKHCMKKGVDYATNKIQWLEHKLKKSTISAAKADNFTLKKNILSTFAP